MNPLLAAEIRLMEEVCQLAAQTLVYLEKFIKPGVTTNELDKIVYDYTLTHGAKPAPLGYHGYPKSICTSVNECICHGVPHDEPLKEGDILNVDVTTFKNGFFGDTSRMFEVGVVSDEARKLCRIAEEAMNKGIEQVAPFNKTGDIGFAINKFVMRNGYSVVEEIGGHGIGKVFHDEPFVPSYGKKGKGVLLKPWSCITVEPMVNQTSAPLVEFPIPGSTVKYYETEDRCLSAQYEHTVLITDTGVKILTLP